MIPASFIQDLLSRVDIVEVVGRHVELRKTGANHMGLCPFHGEKSPSFSVSATKQFYHCFGCGAHGDAIRFLVEHSGMGFIDAVHDLAQQVGMPVPEGDLDPAQREREAQARAHQATLGSVLERAAEHYRGLLRASPEAIAYLKGRGLSGDVAHRFGLGYSPEGWRTLASAFPRYDDPLLVEAGLVIVSGDEGPDQKRYDRFRSRVMFPIRSVKGETIGFGGRVLDQGEPKYLNSPETPVFVKGRELYGLFEARTGLRAKGYALVVEGYMDVVALAQWGYPNAVATLGTACTGDHIQKLLRFTDSVVFSFDGDGAGRRAAGRALEAALPHATDTRQIKFLFLPSEHDPDSYIRELGPEAFEAQVKAAVPLSRQLIDHSAEGCDLATPEGRAHMLANAKPLWLALPDGGVLKRQMAAEFASAAQLQADELLQLWGGQPATRRAAPSPSRVTPAKPQSKAMRLAPAGPADHALRMLLQHSEWWDRLSAEDHDLLTHLTSPHGELFGWLDRQMHEHGPLSWGALQQALDDETLAAAAHHAMGRMAADDDTPFEDLRQVTNTLWRQHLGQRTQALAQRGQLDPEARAELAHLLARLNALKAGPA